MVLPDPRIERGKVVSEHIIPLVGTVSWCGFNKDTLGSILSLQSKLIKWTKERNLDKLKEYLAFCIQQWPVHDKCPIDQRIINQAIDIVGMKTS